MIGNSLMSAQEVTWIIAAVATIGVILRPGGLPEAIWALAGAAALIALQLITPQEALTGIARGTDVYLFLTGMMLLAEVARIEGLFDWLAALATSKARGSAPRLFLLTYGVGTLVTVFLSNDATAVVLTPAVAAAVKAAKAHHPLPYLLICAFVANAASFVLPISNPANLVIYGTHMPPLMGWLSAYLLPSALAIVATYAVLRWTQRKALRQKLSTDIATPPLTAAGKTAAAGIFVTASVLIVSSGLGIQLGLPTAVAGVVTVLIVIILERKVPWSVIKDISWGVLPLVAGLFILVEALEKTGLISAITSVLSDEKAAPLTWTASASGGVVAIASNLMNNLPVGLIAGSAVQGADVPDQVTRAVLIGVDLGPNLSVTGSLATILWLTALRREGQAVGSFAFLKLGALIMPPALLLAIGAAVLLP
jgi:arsenical pump membrane protein